MYIARAFDWNTANAEHLLRHEVSREEAEAFFLFSHYEKRAWGLGKTINGRYLTLVYTIRNGRIRPVTAHTAKRKDRLLYEQSSVGTAAKGNVILPDFKSEREEAERWDGNSDFFLERSRKRGKAVYPTRRKHSR